MSTDNPYAPPSSAVVDPASPPAEDELASTGQRFCNYLLDSVGTMVMAVAIGLVVGMTRPELVQEPGGVLDSWVGGILLVFLYYAGFEALSSRTPAKVVTGTRVVTADGERPTLPQILGRTLARMVPFEPFSFLGGKGFPVGWHDSWSNTRVVRTRGRARRA